jgi:hypothetical protein
MNQTKEDEAFGPCTSKRRYEGCNDDFDEYMYEERAKREKEENADKPRIEMTLDYPLDSQISITTGMTLCTDNGDVKVLKYCGSEVYHQDAMGNDAKGDAPRQLPGSAEWRRYKMLVVKV